MDDVFGMEIFETFIDVSHIWPDLFLCHRSPFFNELLEGSFLAQLSNEIAMVDALEDFIASNVVGMIKCARDGNLLLEEFFQFLEGE
jgi:hypothetical protein